jgi:hypothetical protein
MDIRNLTFEDGTFDIVIDKGKRFPVRDRQQTLRAYKLYAIIHRYDGRHDDSQGRRLGRIPLYFNIPYILIRIQDPPQQVIDDCVKEVDEVLRFGHPPSFWHLNL